jgi:hydrogenase maturation protease
MALELLVIGYGNKLRSDDGFGPAVAECLGQTIQNSHCYEIVVAQQLLPELAEVVASSNVTVLIDASARLAPGEIGIEELYPATQSEQTSGFLMAHSLTPQSLLDLCQSLYGHAPRMTIYTCGAKTLELGETMSQDVRDKVTLVAKVIAERHHLPYADH